MKKNVIYTRVSTKKQKEKGESLEAQEERTKKYCSDNNILNPVLYSDKGKSGGRGKRREYLDILIKEIQEGKIANLVATSIDRLSRSNIDYLIIAELCKENQVEMHMLDIPIDINMPGGKIAHTVRATLAEEERDLISKRTKDSYRARLEKGIYPYTTRSLPLGISRGEDRKLYFNDDIEIVKEVFKLYEKGSGFLEISRYLKTQYPDMKIYKNRVARIITNTIYYGYKEFEGKRYYLIEPIAKESDNLDIEKVDGENSLIKAKRSRINHAHDYELQGRVIYRPTNKLLYVQTRMKKNGLIYKYLYTKDGKYFNENMLIQMIDYYIKKEEQNLCNFKDEKMKRLHKLYINGSIKEQEYKSLKTELDLKIDSHNIIESDIEVDENYNVYFKVNNKEVKFNYKEELEDFRA